MPPSARDAVAAIDSTIAVYEASKAKLEDIISENNFTGVDSSEEIAEVAHLDAEIQTLENRKVHFTAAAVVASAPSATEIAEMRDLTIQIQELATADALRGQTLQFLQNALARARDFSGRVS
jgi:hypothetical protein